MKPIYIKMSAFGSYAGEEIVDFTEVNHGIFLVTGDTGAGKTTLFDALTYALYDQTSGGKRDGEMMRSQFAKEEARTFVELKFIYKNEIYTIIRSPKQNRISKKKNKDGEYTMTVDSPSVELIMPDGLPFKGKLKETNQRIIDIIGLDVNQFTQIAMIAQGDFLKLLHAPSKERKEIFAKIFNTRIYWRIEEELKTLAKALYVKLEDNRKDIEREIENVQYIEGSSYASQWKENARYSESDPETLTALLLNIMEEAKQKENEVGKELRKNQEDLDKLLTSIQQARDINKLFEALEKTHRTKELLDQSKEEMHQIRLKLELAKKASLIEPKEQMYISKKKDIEECRHRIDLIQQWLMDNQQNLDKLKQLKDQTEADYRNNNPELTAKIHKINDLLPKYEQYEEMKTLRNNQEVQKNKGKLELEQLKRNINQISEQQEGILLEQEGLKKAAEQILILVQSMEKLTDRKNSLVGLLDSIRLLKAMRTEMEYVEKNHLTVLKDYEDKIEAYEELYHQFIEGQAGIIAATLSDGSPCPVCGSTSHPQKAVMTEANIGQKELQAAKKLMEAAEKEKQVKYDILQKAKQSYESQKNLADHEGKKMLGTSFQAENTTETEVESYLNDIVIKLEYELKNLSQAEAAKRKFDQNETELKRLGEEQKNLIAGKETKEQALIELELRIVQTDTVTASLKEALIYESKKAAEEELSASNEKVQNLENSRVKTANRYQELLQEITEKLGNRKAEESNLIRLTEELKKVEEVYTTEMINQGFIDEEEYHLSLMDVKKMEDHNNRYQSYREEVIKNEENLRNYKEQTEGKAKVQTDEMEERKAFLDNYKLQLEEQGKAIYGIRTRDEAIYLKIRKLLELRKEAREEYMIINRLDATANGKLSLCHMNFQTYIQRKYFKSILREANKRLYQMSNGQFILQCRDVRELSGQGEVGLDLDIYSMVNDQTRDVKTLSGGESFIAALAMALGMADIIQNTAGSIHIDTMFIDEGFGSLSDKTRTQAINILNGLSEGKRLVGIISHVSELKAMIGTKLVVTKSEKGSKVRWDIA